MIRNFTKSTLLTLAFIVILFMAACSPMAMKRESAIEPDLVIQPGDLFTALDVSLQMGDGRRVDFSPFGLSWEA
jgi:hypothetical protein